MTRSKKDPAVEAAASLLAFAIEAVKVLRDEREVIRRSFMISDSRRLSAEGRRQCAPLNAVIKKLDRAIAAASRESAA